MHRRVPHVLVLVAKRTRPVCVLDLVEVPGGRIAQRRRPTAGSYPAGRPRRVLVGLQHPVYDQRLAHFAVRALQQQFSQPALFAVRTSQQQLREAAALGGPKESLPPAIGVGEKGQVVVQVHPRLGTLFQHLFASTPSAEHEASQGQSPLVAGLRLHVQRPVRRELHPRQVVVRLHGPVQPHHLAVGHVHKPQAHFGVGAAGEGIALRHNPDAVRVYFVPVRLGDRRFVRPREGDVALVRRPPVAVEAVHLLLGDEVRQAVADGAAAIVRKASFSAFPAVGNIQTVQVAVAHVADEVALGGIADAALPRARWRDLPRLARRAVRHGQQPAAAVGRKQDFVLPRVPLVGRDAPGELPAPLAPVPFLPRLFSVLGCRGGAGEQPPGLGAGHVHEPQLQPFAVVLGGEQAAAVATVRRHLQLRRHGRSRKRLAPEQTLRRQFHGLRGI